VQPEQFALLRATFDKHNAAPSQRLVILIADEMFLKKGLWFNRATGRVVGLAEHEPLAKSLKVLRTTAENKAKSAEYDAAQRAKAVARGAGAQRAARSAGAAARPPQRSTTPACAAPGTAPPALAQRTSTPSRATAPAAPSVGAGGIGVGVGLDATPKRASGKRRAARTPGSGHSTVYPPTPTTPRMPGGAPAAGAHAAGAPAAGRPAATAPGAGRDAPGAAADSGDGPDKVPLAEHMLQFMAVGLLHPIEVPVSYFGISQLNGAFMTKLLTDVLAACAAAGVIPVGLVTDGFRGFLSMEDIICAPMPRYCTCVPVDMPVAFLNPFNGNLPVFCIPDPDHKMKNMITALMSRAKRQATWDGLPVTIRFLLDYFWRHVQNNDTATMILHGLTLKHVSPSNKERMSVPLSHQTLKYCAKLPPEECGPSCEGTRKYGAFMVRGYEAWTSRDKITCADSPALLAITTWARELQALVTPRADGAPAVLHNFDPILLREMLQTCAGMEGMVRVYLEPINTGRTADEIFAARALGQAVALRGQPLYILAFRVSQTPLELNFNAMRGEGLLSAAGSTVNPQMYEHRAAAIAAAGACRPGEGGSFAYRDRLAAKDGEAASRYHSGPAAYVPDGGAVIKLGDATITRTTNQGVAVELNGALADLTARAIEVAAGGAAGAVPKRVAAAGAQASEAARVVLQRELVAKKGSGKKQDFAVSRFLRALFRSAVTAPDAASARAGGTVTTEIERESRGYLIYPTAAWTTFVARALVTTELLYNLDTLKRSAAGPLMLRDGVFRALCASSHLRRDFDRAVGPLIASGWTPEALDSVFHRMLGWTIGTVQGSLQRTALSSEITATERIAGSRTATVAVAHGVAERLGKMVRWRDAGAAGDDSDVEWDSLSRASTAATTSDDERSDDGRSGAGRRGAAGGGAASGARVSEAAAGGAAARARR